MQPTAARAMMSAAAADAQRWADQWEPRVAMKMDEIDRIFPQMLSILERDLRVPLGMLKRLLDESDWELVIRSSVIAEVALGEAIQRAIKHKGVAGPGERVDYGLGRKVRVAKKLGLLTETQANHLRCLADMRNLCVHDRAGLSFTFDAYLAVPTKCKKFLAELGGIAERGTRPENLPPNTFVSPSAAVLARVVQVCVVLLVGQSAMRPH